MSPDSPASGETIIRVMSEHWIKYVFPVCLYLVLTAVSVLLFLFAGMTAHHQTWLSYAAFIAALLLFLIAHHWFFVKLLSESMTHIVITTRRVIWLRESLFVHERMMEYAFEKMKTVEAGKQGLLQTILRYGTISFEGGAAIPFVPHPNRAVKDIEQAMGLR